MLCEKFSRLHALADLEYMHYLSFVQWLNHAPLGACCFSYYDTQIRCQWIHQVLCLYVFVKFFSFSLMSRLYVMATLCKFTNAIKNFFHLFSGASCIDCRTRHAMFMKIMALFIVQTHHGNGYRCNFVLFYVIYTVCSLKSFHFFKQVANSQSALLTLRWILYQNDPSFMYALFKINDERLLNL